MRYSHYSHIHECTPLRQLKLVVHGDTVLEEDSLESPFSRDYIFRWSQKPLELVFHRREGVLVVGRLGRQDIPCTQCPFLYSMGRHALEDFEDAKWLDVGESYWEIAARLREAPKVPFPFPFQGRS